MIEYIVRETGYPGAVKQEVVGELVRCKDCRWGGHTICEASGMNTCGFGDEYCSYGERKDDAVD